MAEIPEGSKPIVGRDDDGACERGQVLAVLRREVSGGVDEGTSMEPYDDRCI